MPDCVGLADFAVSEPEIQPLWRARAASIRFRNVFRVRGLMPSNAAMISRPQESGAGQAIWRASDNDAAPAVRAHLLPASVALAPPRPRVWPAPASWRPGPTRPQLAHACGADQHSAVSCRAAHSSWLWLCLLRQRPAEVFGQSLAAVVHRPCDALHAKPLQAAAKAVCELAEKIDIKSIAGYRVHFHALGCEAQRGRAPA
jgi:hypothetical protein